MDDIYPINYVMWTKDPTELQTWEITMRAAKIKNKIVYEKDGYRMEFTLSDGQELPFIFESMMGGGLL